MTRTNLGEGFLRQLPVIGAIGQNLERRYPLTTTQELVIGREPSCQIYLDSTGTYGMVSRRHTAVRPLPTSSSSYPRWDVCDLNSANGTYVNGQRLQGCRELQPGDRIKLGNNGPEFIFECVRSYQSTQLSSPPVANAGGGQTFQHNGVSFTQLFPIVSTGRDLTSKAFLIPGAITVIFVVLLLAAVGRPGLFDLLLAAYLGVGALYFVYRLCGKPKPWWVLFGSAFATVLILLSPLLNLLIFVFRGILPGNVAALPQEASFPVLLFTFFFGAGLLEELLKALPVLGVFLLGYLFPRPWRSRVGIVEPLDGILVGAASAVGFTLVETLGQYVPMAIESVAKMQAGPEAGQLVGLQLLIPRILAEVSGHMAYSGYFGYFIGLSVLRPRYWWSILPIGYLTAAALHAFWDATATSLGLLFLMLVGIASYAFLMAAILKARALSPTRSQNFATRFIGGP
jgi:RsiW-degrading membrane proteinase PrsW (M82 family)